VLVDKVKVKTDESGLDGQLVRAVAENYAKLLAYKDEYEVARLYTNGDFEKRLNEQFEGDFTLNFNLAPPMLPGVDPNGRPKKRVFGPWLYKSFARLAKLKGLRGTPFDIFGYHPDRKAERQLIKDYETMVDNVLSKLDESNQHAAIKLLSLPADIRGYGPVKAESIAKAKRRQGELQKEFEHPTTPETDRAIAA